MTRDAAHLDDLIARLVDDPWPIGEPDRRAWAARLGLPVDGTELEDGLGIEGARSFETTVDGTWVVWSVVPEGLCYVGAIRSAVEHRGSSAPVTPTDPGAGAEFAELRRTATQLRTALDRRWDPTYVQEIDGGFGAFWEPSGRIVELYFRAPTEHRPGTIDSSIQIGVSHVERSAEAQDAPADGAR